MLKRAPRRPFSLSVGAKGTVSTALCEAREGSVKMDLYDFNRLSDKEFEVVCCDLIAAEERVRVERFKAGKDEGIDGRFFSSGKRAILQCKHWARSSVPALVRALRKTELPKIQKLKPRRYILLTSLPLSPKNKKAISEAVHPFIVDESDIYGAGDLNALLMRHKEIETQHYKLWMASTNILQAVLHGAVVGRSDFVLGEIVERGARYVTTAAHQQALRKLDKAKVVIVTGEAGVGKTTLAEQLCLDYARKGFQLVVFNESVEEVEGVFRKKGKQIFYFDDFLGRNYLSALDRHEDSSIVNFIRRVQKADGKRFVLTSRTNVLNQGKRLSDQFDIHNLGANEFEVRVTALSRKDRARILYNHLWFSELPLTLIHEVFRDRRYRGVIEHRNFNPRLISFITDPTRVGSVEPKNYWKYIQDKLDDPADVWDHTFNSQLDDFGRAIIILIVFNDGYVWEDEFPLPYQRYIEMPSTRTIYGVSDLKSNIRTLTGSLISRVSTTSWTRLHLFNPSVADYVIRRYKADGRAITNAVLALQSRRALSSIEGLVVSSLVDANLAKTCLKEVCHEHLRLDVDHPDVAYLEFLCYVAVKMGVLDQQTRALIRHFVLMMVTDGIDVARWDQFPMIIDCLLEHGDLTVGEIQPILERIDWQSLSREDLEALSRMRLALEAGSDWFRQPMKDGILSYWRNSATSELEEQDALSDFEDEEDLESAERHARESIEGLLRAYGLPLSWAEIESVVYECNVRKIVAENHRRASKATTSDKMSRAQEDLLVEDIDDLFDTDFPPRRSTRVTFR